MMERVISNQFDARISQHAISAVLNIKLILGELRPLNKEYNRIKNDPKVWNTKHIKANMDRLSGMLHKHISGWS